MDENRCGSLADRLRRIRGLDVLSSRVVGGRCVIHFVDRRVDLRKVVQAGGVPQWYVGAVSVDDECAEVNYIRPATGSFDEIYFPDIVCGVRLHVDWEGPPKRVGMQFAVCSDNVEDAVYDVLSQISQ